MPRLSQIGSHRTAVKDSPDSRTVQYHDTVVVEVRGPRVILRTDGWLTTTTKARMNQAAQQWGLGFQVSAHQGQWSVTCGPDPKQIHPFQGPAICFNWQTGQLLSVR